MHTYFEVSIYIQTILKHLYIQTTRVWCFVLILRSIQTKRPASIYVASVPSYIHCTPAVKSCVPSPCYDQTPVHREERGARCRCACRRRVRVDIYFSDPRKISRQWYQKVTSAHQPDTSLISPYETPLLELCRKVCGEMEERCVGGDGERCVGG